MRSIRWSSRSIADLEGIHAFIAEDSAHYANLVVVRIVRAVGRLAEFPESGRIVPEVGDGRLREVIQRPYRIVYRIRSDLVEIVTVFRATKLLPEVDG